MMAPRNRNNPLALAILICLFERPMHPYEMATTLRQRNKNESVRLNFGSLYAIVASLDKRGLITARDTEREGRLPERTIYELTEAGRIEMHDWLGELISVPTKEYPEFEAALSFLPALAPDVALALLEERSRRLEFLLAQSCAAREFVENLGLPKLFWIEHEFHAALLEAELAFVEVLRGEIADGSLDGAAWWRYVYDNPGAPNVEGPAELRAFEDSLRQKEQKEQKEK